MPIGSNAGSFNNLLNTNDPVRPAAPVTTTFINGNNNDNNGNNNDIVVIQWYINNIIKDIDKKIYPWM